MYGLTAPDDLPSVAFSLGTNLFLLLRTCEAATLSRAVTAAWTKVVAQARFPPAARTTGFFARRAARLVATAFVYAWTHEYLAWHRPFAAGGRLLVDLRNPADVAGALAFGLQLYAVLEMILGSLLLMSCMALGCDYIPVMDDPFVAPTLREFWSRRWNSVVKGALQRLAFTPTLRLLAWIDLTTRGGVEKHKATAGQAKTGSGCSEAEAGKESRPRRLHVMVAVLATFLASGLFHEWIVGVIFSTAGQALSAAAAAGPAVGAVGRAARPTLVLPLPEPSTFRLEQVGFFMWQGAWCVVERAVASTQAARRAPRWAAATAGYVSCFAGLVVPAPMFIGALSACGLFTQFKMPLPDPFWQAAEALVQ
ncbi:hypothetical protein HK405_000152 [Cladochytrium tenue]|nr:hypothetical protein HK405_000152 [Cladochytrium tenue]